MSENRKVSVGKRVRYAIAVFALVLIVLEVWGITYSRQVEIEEATASVSNVTRALAQHAENTFKEADLVIAGVVERLQYDGLSPSGIERTHRELMARLRALPQLNGVYVQDQDGNVVISSKENIQEGANRSDRGYFIYHHSHPELDSHIGEPLQSRTTGRWVYTLSRRINHPDGSFGGVVIANIDMEYFSSFYRSFDIGGDGAIALIRSDGILLYRRPMRDELAGKNMTGTALFTAYQQHKETGTALIKSSQDGVTRINVYRSVDNYPLFVAVAMSIDEVLEDWRRATLLHGGSVLLLLIAVLYAGNKLITQLNSRSKAELEAVDSRAKTELLNRSLEEMAMQDVLTGLPNRRQFDVLLKSELDTARQHASAVALLMLDVDHFKVFDHLYGHTSSDDCLRAITAALKAALAHVPYRAARYGGEQFGVILPGCALNVAISHAEKIRTAVAALDIPHWENEQGVVTVSIGVSCLDPVDENDLGADLIRSADHALHTAKQKGHDQVASFSLPKIARN